MGIREAAMGSKVRRGRSWWFVALSVLAVVLVGASACSSDDDSSSAPETTTTVIGGSGASGGGAEVTDEQLELNLAENGPEWTTGEPEIAVDPTNPDNVFYNWNSFPVPLDVEADLDASCGSLVSHDAGQTWQEVEVPVNSVPDTLGCGDNVAAAGPNGELYAGGITPTFTAIAEGGIAVGGEGIVVHGRDMVSRSDDWGETWTTPAIALSSDAARFATTGGPVDTFDRPWLEVDQSDGTVYMSGRNLAGSNERWVTASTDKAESFGTVYPIDSPEYPQAGGGAIAAAHGTLAVLYTAGEAPGETCPCLIFETSTDFGETFERHIVPAETVPGGLGTFVTANPTEEGQFALALLDKDATQVDVYVTPDGGETWQGPVPIGEEPPNPRFKPWISYSTAGDLDIVWRTLYSDSSYDVWAATGTPAAGGVVFSEPVKVTSEAAPYPDGYYGGDDLSFVVGDDRFVHVAWGDSREGPTQAWYGRVPRSAFG